MRFETLAPADALGWTLAHSLRVGPQRIPKNSVISAEIIAQLEAANIDTVSAYRLEDGDIDENTAAKQTALHIAGNFVRSDQPSRGRCNLYAEKTGLFIPDESVNSLNAVSPDIGIATLPPFAPVTKGKLVATVKTIPYGISQQQLDTVTATPVKISVKPYRAFTTAILATGTPMTDKTTTITKNRVAGVNGKVMSVGWCAHSEAEIANSISAIATTDVDLLLVSGISAISDLRDTVPAAIKASGGTIVQLGMPVDPGNLLMLGELGAMTVIGMPGCAKSPSLNGFDWVLERFAANLPLDGKALQNMGIGGLLKEMVERPEPRAPSGKTNAGDTPAIILAAGTSSRSGPTHKLLALLDGKPVIEQSILGLKDAGFEDIYVVTGARADAVEAALKGMPTQLVHNPLFESGMASSLAAGIRALPQSAEQCFICLGDMPFINSATFGALISAANQISEAQIFAPIFKGKRGNPVLWRKSQFEKLANISGDKGGRALIAGQENLVCAVPVDDPGILIDLDTPEALAQFGVKVTG